MRCAPQVNGAARDTRTHVETVAAAELRSAIDNPVGAARRPGVMRELPRRAGGPRLRLPRDRGRGGGDRRAAHGPDARPGALLRAAAVPHRGRRVNSGWRSPTTRRRRWWPRTAACACRRAQTPCPPARCRRTTSRWAGGRGALRTVVANLSRILDGIGAARALDLRASLSRGSAPRRAGGGARGGARPGADRWLAPELAEAEALVASGAVVDVPSRTRSGASMSARPFTRRVAASSPAVVAGRRRRRSAC